MNIGVLHELKEYRHREFRWPANGFWAIGSWFVTHQWDLFCISVWTWLSVDRVTGLQLHLQPLIYPLLGIKIVDHNTGYSHDKY